MSTLENTQLITDFSVERDIQEQVRIFAEKLGEFGTEMESFTPQYHHLMPSIFGKTTDEDFISDWLAYILAPTVNSIGVEPLNALLRLAVIDKQLDEKDVILSEKPGQYHVIRERWLSDKDRIDFLIKVKRPDGTLVIAIENKVFSGLSKDNQLVSYTNHLRKEYNESNHSEVVMIFLARQVTIDSIKSKELLGEFVAVSHENLTEELKRLVSRPIKNQRAAFLVQEYVYNMEQNILNKGKNMINLTDEMTDFLCNKNKEIEKIVKMRNELYQTIREEVYTRVAECFDNSYKCSGLEENDELDSNSRVDGNKYYCYWHKQKHPWFLHYEIEFKGEMFDDNGYILVSVCLHYEGEKKNRKAEKLRERIRSFMTEEYTPSPAFSKHDHFGAKDSGIVIAKLNAYRIENKKSIEELGIILRDEMNKIIKSYDEALEKIDII